MEAKLDKLKESLKALELSPEYSYFGHGTSQSCAESILQEGLASKGYQLDGTSLVLFDPTRPYAQQDDASFQKLLNWPHYNYKSIVLLKLPNPSSEQAYGRYYFDSALQELPEDKKVNVGVAGADKNYYVPPEFIKGYVNARTAEFILNPKYDANKKIQMRTFPEVSFAKKIQTPDPSLEFRMEDWD